MSRTNEKSRKRSCTTKTGRKNNHNVGIIIYKARRHYDDEISLQIKRIAFKYGESVKGERLSR